MKKIITLIIALSFFSCNDGDFDTPEFEFEDTIYSCFEYVLYVTNSNKTEAMAMTLIDAQLGTTVGEASYPVSSSLEIVYRLFDTGIGNDYFCQLIPATSPKVLTELNADSAMVNIITAEIYKDNVLTGYSYEITISDLLFIDGSDRIFYETFPFGTFTINL
ncbi:MAG: hypothetical protein IZT56_07510 [Bacteroidetes bacterium]|nr:hypothetical protein [Bacteroidota bacterium]